MAADNGSTDAREYIVLGQHDADCPEVVWMIVGTGLGSNAAEARDTVVDSLPKDEQAGTFVAVLARSWQPKTRSTETKVIWS